MSSIAARRANKRVCPLQPNGILSRGTHGILAQMGEAVVWSVVREKAIWGLYIKRRTKAKGFLSNDR